MLAVAKMREDKAQTQEQFARLLNVSVATLQKWERGTRPSREFVARIAKILGADANPLLEELGLPLISSTRQDGYYKLREDLEVVIASGQSQLIGQVEEMLDRCADNARHMTRKNKRDKLDRAVQRHVSANVGESKT